MRSVQRLLVVLCLLSYATLAAIAAPAESCVSVPVASVFRQPSAQSERVTQVLLGERVKVLKTEGGWARVLVTDQYRLAEGYPGFMLASALAAAPPAGDMTVTVKVPRASIRDEANGRIVHTAYMGTTLQARAVSGRWVPVLLPGRDEPAFVDAREVVEGKAALSSGDDVVRTALQLRGTRYLWGGLSASGIDCSGLTFESFRIYGITLPRDADQQSKVGTRVDREHLQAGDLVFFSGRPGVITHVGIYWKDGQFVEAAGRSGVTVTPLASRGGYQWAQRVIGVPLRMPAPSP